MKDKQKLIDRLSRIQGQIGGLKKRIEENEQDCTEIIRQLKTIVQGLKKFGQAYMEDYAENCIQKDQNESNMNNKLKKVIKSAFSL